MDGFEKCHVCGTHYYEDYLCPMCGDEHEIAILRARVEELDKILWHKEDGIMKAWRMIGRLKIAVVRQNVKLRRIIEDNSGRTMAAELTVHYLRAKLREMAAAWGRFMNDDAIGSGVAGNTLDRLTAEALEADDE